MPEYTPGEYIKVLESEKADLLAALEAGVEHMIWMAGAWGNPGPTKDTTWQHMRDGISEARAAIVKTRGAATNSAEKE